ncbi:lipid II:glycine glycyltransferase FemX [Luteipulveratus mongoliensis]|uniref:Methicillin resistance protein n=1 Tax=Luteipulveratus mongoliensis TaxID=571913 RepID=A0A0K1JIV3_9MICO|nr:peptidoglycan bridge formation glycyltransferase FemA/FemB family protein [Luteipulveratus mongoliensis]AKU16636.1 methicillin resistance protein [Luteipulveratus mongoliensis]
MSLSVTSCHDKTEWDALVDAAGGHPLQLWGWGELKSRYEWSADRVVVRDGDTVIGSAQVLLRRLPAPFRSLAYVPRGPQAKPQHRGAVLRAVSDYIKGEHKPIAITIEPDWAEPFSPLPKGEVDEAIAAGRAAGPSGWLADVQAAGFERSDNTGLIPRTLIVDVTRDEDTILKELSSTTRQNVRKSFRAENVRFGEVTDEADLLKILEINRETARRAEFAVHDDDYHRGIRDLMGPQSQLLAAWEGDEPVAFVWLVVSGTTAFELYGGVSPRGMKLRLNYGLKFHAMKYVKAQGVERYDFNGLLNDGISDFKRQFAKHEDLLIGTWDKPLSPMYPAFAKALPMVRSGLKRGLPTVKKAVRDPLGTAAHAKEAVQAKVRERRTQD